MLLILYAYLFTASFALFGATLVARNFERATVTPATIFFVLFLAQAFITPISQYESEYLTLDVNNLREVLALSLQSFLAMLAGYALYVLRFRTFHAKPLNTLVSPNGARLLIFTTAGCCALMVVYTLIASEGLQLARGATSYDTEVSIFGRLGIVAVLSVSPLLLALFAAMNTSGMNVRPMLRVSFYVIFSVVIVLAMASFARQQVVLTLLAIGVFMHYRIKRFNWKSIAFSALLLVCVAAAAKLRSVTASALTLTTPELLAEFGASFLLLLNPVTFLREVGGAIAGQEVFSQVLNIVPHYEDYSYGRTYLESIIGLFTPRVLTGDYERITTPAYWFREWYAPTVTTHGFDFSMLSEAYMNFGDALFIPFFFLGAAVAAMSTAIVRSRSTLLVVWLIFAWISLIYGLRTDSNALLKALTYQFLPVLVVIFLDRKIFGNKVSPDRPTANREHVSVRLGKQFAERRLPNRP